MDVSDDDFDALEEEISAIQSHSIRLMARNWPRVEEDGTSRGDAPLSRFRLLSGDNSRDEAIGVDAESGERAEEWMAHAENTLKTHSHASTIASTEKILVELSDTATTRTVHDVESELKKSYSRTSLLIGASAAIAFTFVTARLVTIFVFYRRATSPLRVVESLALRGLSNLPAPFVHPVTLIEFQKKAIDHLSEEKVVLLERLRLSRKMANEQRSIASTWRDAFVKCRSDKRDEFVDRAACAASSLEWSPAWSLYAIDRSGYLRVPAKAMKNTADATKSFIRRALCPFLIKCWPSLKTSRRTINE